LTLEELLRQAAGAVSFGLEALALLVIVIGAVEAAAGMFRVILQRHMTADQKRTVWLDFSHWLVAALTFQLAADIVRTMIVPGWDDIGRVAAIAVIRTFLTFFLDRDIDTLRERNARGGEHAGSA
jgi:uncharacterized membrane protein